MTDRDDDSTRPDRWRPGVDRARLDAVFGDSLPETTSDEARDPDAGIGDRWWREQRPPHHD